MTEMGVHADGNFSTWQHTNVWDGYCGDPGVPGSISRTPALFVLV